MLMRDWTHHALRARSRRVPRWRTRQGSELISLRGKPPAAPHPTSQDVPTQASAATYQPRSDVTMRFSVPRGGARVYTPQPSKRGWWLEMPQNQQTTGATLAQRPTTHLGSLLDHTLATACGTCPSTSTQHRQGLPLRSHWPSTRDRLLTNRLRWSPPLNAFLSGLPRLCRLLQEPARHRAGTT